MTDTLVPSGDGHTDLSEEDRQGLIPTYIATRGDLNDAEQRNITQAMLRSPPSTEELLDEIYLRELHHAMFDKVWEWAGRYRRRETNIGIEPRYIATEVNKLVGDARVWVEESTFPSDELAVRFHHRLVAIHAFPNGNGRHGRIAANFLVESLGEKPFTWGTSLNTDTSGLRLAYRKSLERADRNDISDLLTFARA